MIALIIIIALLLLLLCLSVGVDAAYDSEGLSVKLKIGPVKKALIPADTKNPKKEKKKKEKKPKKEETDEEKPKRELPFKLTLHDLKELLSIVFRMLGRLGRGLSVDRLVLHVLVAAEDPYDAVMRYGALNAGLSSLAGPAHSALKIRSEDIQTCVDLEAEKPIFVGQIVLTIQIWEILYAVLCAGGAAGVWYLRKRREKAAVRKRETETEPAEAVSEEKGS